MQCIFIVVRTQTHTHYTVCTCIDTHSYACVLSIYTLTLEIFSQLISTGIVLILVIHSFLPQSPLPPSLGKEVCSIKLPDMPMVAVSFGATIHNGKVYISTIDDDDEFRVLVYSTNEQKWNVMEGTEQHQHQGSAITLVNDHITLIGGVDMKADIPTTTPSTWYEEEGQWKQVLPPMPTGRLCGTVISHDNLLLVTGGVAEDDSTILNTTDVLDLTTMKWTTPEGLNLPVPLWWHHVALCGEYLYLVGGMKVFERQEDSNSSEDSDSSEDVNSQAWRAKWSDVK